jgi:hypothetical protein
VTGAQEVTSPWRSLTPGIDYREFFLPEPNHVYVTRLDRTNPNVLIETSLANGMLSGGLEPVSDQAARYDQALSHWGGAWGGRYKVIAAVNGGFFNTDSGFPTGGLSHNGWYARRFDDRQTAGGFAWRSDRQAFVVECIIQRPGKQRIILLETNESISYDGINNPPEDNQLVIYTPQFGSHTPALEEGLEILVELGRPLEILPDSETITGTVREIRQDQGSTPLPFDHIVFSANGAAAQAMTGKFEPGAQVGIVQEVRHLEQGCRNERPEGLEGVFSAMAGSYIFLRQGQIEPLEDLGSVLRNPRTAIAFDDQYIYFIVVDGRDQLRSLGMSMVELALFAKLHLGAASGVAMDGGGSATMVVGGEVMNNPNAETIVRPRPEKQPRAVADGLLMVLLEPAETSQRFTVGDPVAITEEGDANIRLGPGTNYPPLAVLPPGAQGFILEHPLNGIFAKGFYWWKIAFGEQVGWASESVLR